MTHNQLTEILRDFRSYRYAVHNCGGMHALDDMTLPVVISERRRNPNQWDATRYSRIVSAIECAVNDVLSDDQRTVIMRKYMDRNTLTLNEIADITRQHRSTVSRWHKEALRRLTIALQPFAKDEQEITNFDHMFLPTA